VRAWQSFIMERKTPKKKRQPRFCRPGRSGLGDFCFARCCEHIPIQNAGGRTPRFCSTSSGNGGAPFRRWVCPLEGQFLALSAGAE